MTRPNPLILKEERVLGVLIVFISPEIGKAFLQNHPGNGGDLLTDFKWIVEKIGTNHAISINPENEVGFDLDAEILRQLCTPEAN